MVRLNNIAFLFCVLFTQLTFSYNDFREKIYAVKESDHIKSKFIDLNSYAVFNYDKSPVIEERQYIKNLRFNATSIFKSASILNLNLKRSNELSLAIKKDQRLWIFNQVSLEFKKYVNGPKFVFLKAKLLIF